MYYSCSSIKSEIVPQICIHNNDTADTNCGFKTFLAPTDEHLRLTDKTICHLSPFK